MDIKDVKEFYRGLRTYRRFKQDKITNKMLYDILDCARLAPSGMNGQVIRYIAVNSDEKVKGMQDLVKFAAMLPPELGTPKVGEQPTAFIVLLKPENAGAYYDIDAGIATDTIITAAWTQGIGSTIMKNINPKAIAELLSVPDDETVFMVIAMGIPGVKSTVVDVPADGSLKYYLDEDKNYYVPKLKVEDISRFE